MIDDCALYADGHRVRTVSPEELADTATGAGEFLWVAVKEPDEATLGVLQQRFALHPLAVEDATRAHQRPKLEEYDNAVFLVMRTARWDEERGSIDLGELHVFLGESYLVFVHHGEQCSLHQLRDRCEAVPHLLAKGPTYVLYALMDAVVDGYFPLADDLEDQVALLEGKLFSATLESDLSQHIYELKAQLGLFRRAISPLLEVLNRLTRLDVSLVSGEERLYFRDIYDHVIRVNETIDTLRELLSGALEVNLALVSVRAERDHAAARGLGGDPRRADPRYRDLRHELPLDPRAWRRRSGSRSSAWRWSSSAGCSTGASGASTGCERPHGHFGAVHG